MVTRLNNLRLALILALVSASLLAAASGDLSQRTPADVYRASVEAGRGILAPYPTLTDMSAFVGAPPERCVEAAGGAKICVFSLSNKEQGWWSLAKALGTSDRLNLVCEFPANDAPRLADSCSVNPRRSNRNYYKRAIKHRKSTSKLPRSVKLSKEAELVTQLQLLDSAGTATELSALVGDAPSKCLPEKGSVLCTWPTSSATYGHGTLVMSIHAKFSQRVRLDCSLPSDGSRRPPDSCTVTIGK